MLNLIQLPGSAKLANKNMKPFQFFPIKLTFNDVM